MIIFREHLIVYVHKLALADSGARLLLCDLGRLAGEIELANAHCDSTRGNHDDLASRIFYIADNLNEIRLEKALAAELQLTQQVIKKTGIFDPTDRIYGDPEAKYDYSQAEEGGEGGPGGGAGGGMPGGDIGGDMGGVDSLGGPEGGDVGGAEESMGMDAAPVADSGEAVAESRKAKKNLITELIEHAAGKKDYVPYFNQYINKITKEQREEETSLGRVETISENFIINEELNSIVGELDAIIAEGTLEEKAKAEYPKIELDDEILND